VSPRIGWLDRLSHRDRRALLLGAAVLVPALLWIVVVRPYRDALVGVRERIAAEQALLAREESLIAGEETLPQAIDVALAGAERAERRLVSAANATLAEAELTDYLESAAARSRVLLEELRGVSPGRDSTSVEGVQPIRLSASGESDLSGVTSMLRRIEDGALLVRVSELSIEPILERPRGERRQSVGAARPTGYVRFNMIIEAYAPAEPAVEGRAPSKESNP
jgi:hypothetical protein